ncbi:aldo/keto reductase [Bacillus daqingensis]|uniref:Aldo/keto reductase n=1 Tax=Bacillus daqingensis TaxID=872396 RepID=A0ABV9NSY1_9BACI
MKSLADTWTLANGTEMPCLGFGVYKVDQEETGPAVRTAIETGYRLIDTASYYDNESETGQAIRDGGVSRETLFLTTKVWNTEQGYEETLRAFEKSRKKLGVDYVDMYLIHWPDTPYPETWRAIEKLYREGWIRAAGVSNFLVRHLQRLQETAEIQPMVNQVEYHPWLTQPELYNYCRNNNIQLQAWSPLTRGRKLKDPELVRMAQAYSKTPAQIILRWNMQRHVAAVPKSVTPERIRENAAITDFELSSGDVDTMTAWNEDMRFGSSPEKFA